MPDYVLGNFFIGIDKPVKRYDISISFFTHPENISLLISKPGVTE